MAPIAATPNAARVRSVASPNCSQMRVKVKAYHFSALN